MEPILLFAALIACSGEVAAPPLSPQAERGKAVYAANCTACHNVDPSKAGSLGPELKGSTRELVEARVMRAEYPAGYTPKRTSKLMPALPKLSTDIDALAAYLK